MSTFTRRALGALAVTAATLAAATAPALAAEPAAAPSVAGVVSGNGGLGSGPNVYIMRPGAVMPQVTGRVTPIPANRPVELGLAFQLGGKSSTYTDVHFASSNPGTASCDMSKIYSAIAASGWLYNCPVTLPAMKPGTSKYYWVTMTGKRDGVPFKITKNTLVYAPNVEVGIYVDGYRADGRWYGVPKNSSFTVKYVVDNNTPRPLYDMADFMDEAPRCTIKYIAPGKSGVCSFRMTGSELAYDTQHFGGFQMWDLSANFGGDLWGHIGTAPRTYLVAK